MEQNQEVERIEAEAPSASGTKIRPDTATMVASKTATGGKTFHKGDEVGNALAGLTLDSVKALGADFGIDVEKYSHLNPGQQRMTIGNVLRGKAKKDESGEVAASIAEKAEALRNTQEVPEKPKRARAAKAEEAGEADETEAQ